MFYLVSFLRGVLLMHRANKCISGETKYPYPSVIKYFAFQKGVAVV